MNAVHGFVAARDGSLDARAVRAMDADEGGRWSGSRSALGTSSRADPGPLTVAAGHVVVADARLDNRRDLARELAVGELPDSGLILAAYERWGSDCPSHLAGAFAFALWDHRRERLFCARDHIGLRPFYFWHDEEEFAFASDPEPLLATGRPPGTADELAFAAKLVDHHGILMERSFHAGIAKLPPGQCLEVAAGGRVSRWTYWAPGPREPLRLRRDDEYADALRETLQLSVADAVRGERHVGAHFSGGLDSSAIAVIAQEALRREGGGLARLYSWSPPPAADGGAGDERGRVRSLAASLGVDVQWTAVTPAVMENDFLRDTEPVPNETSVYERAILADARAHGIDVLLSGWGGDETASYHGHGHARWLARSGQWGALLREARATSRRRGHRGPRLARDVASRMAAAARAGADDGAVWVDLSDVHPLARELQRDVARRTRTRLSPQDTQVALLSAGHLTARVEAWAHAGRRAGVDYRHPMLDRRMIDLCLSFPPEVWVKDGQARWPFRQAMTPLLPAELCWGDPKHEPARIGAYLELFMGDSAPPRGADPVRADRIGLRRARQRETLRRQAAPGGG